MASKSYYGMESQHIHFGQTFDVRPPARLKRERTELESLWPVGAARLVLPLASQKQAKTENAKGNGRCLGNCHKLEVVEACRSCASLYDAESSQLLRRLN
jgi:hypothetical protein